MSAEGGGGGEEPSVVIRTDKSQYVGGDSIYGSLYLRVPSGCTATSLKLVVRGFELCEFDYHYVVQQAESFQTKVGQRKARKELLRAELKLVEHPAGFPEGNFAYPFHYQLPHGLPGIFGAKHEDRNSGRVWEGIVRYSLGALLETTDGPTVHAVLGDTSLTVFDSIECSQPGDSRRIETHSGMGSVKTFFCIHRGDVKVTSRLDRLAYSPNEKVLVELNVVNGSAVDVSDVTVKIIRVIKLHGLDKSQEEELTPHTVYDTITEVVHAGCSKNSTKKSTLELDLNQLCDSDARVPTTTNGALIKCNYVIDIDVHIPWAPDIEVRQPLIMKPAIDAKWDKWDPPKWVNKCSQEKVTGTCVVPSNILVSQSYSGMPSFQPIL